MLGPKEIMGLKKKFCPKKKFVSKTSFGSEKNLEEKILFPKKYFNKKISKKEFGCQ